LENPELTENPAPELEAVPTAEDVLAKAREEAEEKLRLMEEEARQKASEIEGSAQKQAEQIIAQAKAKAEAEAQVLKQEAGEAGKKEGHEQGYQSGFEKGRAEGADTYSSRVKEMALVLQSATEERKRLLGEMQPLLVDLVGEALYECLKKKGKSGNTVVHFVEEALKKAGDRVQLKVHLNPSDVETVESEIQNLQLSVGAGEIELVPDARIEQGGCLLVTEAGSVDVRLPTVVAQVKDALRSEG
jgi:flagellar assembly protein FliH